MSSHYQTVYQQSIQQRQSFWAKAAAAIDWFKPYDKVLDADDAPFYRWFAGGELNTCYNAVDRHVQQGYGEQTALIYDSPVSDSKETISYQQLQQRTGQLASTLLAQGVTKGDRVIIYMPMTADAVVAMLACARIGAIHSVVFGGFAAKELAVRIDDCQPKLILSASCGIEPNRTVDYKALLDEAIRQAQHPVNTCIIKQRTQQPCQLIATRDLDWDEAVADQPIAECVSVAATDPLYILYTSGTTGKPKGIVRDNGGHAVAMQWTMKNLYNIEPGDVYWAASDVGWVVGHSYIVYAPLLNRNTSIVFEGKPVGTPDASVFWRVIEEHQVNVLFTAPTAIRAIKKEDSQGEFPKQYDLSCLQALYLAGERCDPDTVKWSQMHLQVPVIDHWWQTETAWAIVCNPLGIESFPVKLGSSTKPVPGYEVVVINDQGEKLAANALGNIVVKLPLPPGTLTTIWQAHDRYFSSYLKQFPGYYLSGDSGIIDDDGYVHIMSRIDDVINVAGHRLSTGQMEEILCNHADIAEAAVFGVLDDFKGELPLGLAVCNNRCTTPTEQLEQQLLANVRDQLGPVASFKLIRLVQRLPKTRSGKILRGTMRKMANGQPWDMPATIDDPSILTEIEQALQSLGYASKQ